MAYAVAYYMSNRIASIAPVASAALLGFDEVPKFPTSIMEIHGTGDSIIPANTSESYNGNVAPDGATFSSDGFYYVSQPQMTNGFAKGAKCSAADQPGKAVLPYHTDFDGIRGLSCVKPYGKCDDGVDVVQCSGGWGHTWPLNAQVPLAYGRMIYDFFAAHPLADAAHDA